MLQTLWMVGKKIINSGAWKKRGIIASAPNLQTLPFLLIYHRTWWLDPYRCWTGPQRRCVCKENVRSRRGAHRRAGEAGSRVLHFPTELVQGLCHPGTSNVLSQLSRHSPTLHPAPWKETGQRRLWSTPSRCASHCLYTISCSLVKMLKARFLTRGLHWRQHQWQEIKEAEVYQQIWLSICLTSVPK